MKSLTSILALTTALSGCTVYNNYCPPKKRPFIKKRIYLEETPFRKDYEEIDIRVKIEDPSCYSGRGGAFVIE